MSAADIDQPYGKDLEAIEHSIAAIIEQYFRDPDSFFYCVVNGLTNRPYTDADPDLDYPLEKTWWANGGFPYELKRTFLNYEDSDMMAGEVLQAYLARAQANPTDANWAAADDLAELMLEVGEKVGRENPYGFGFLPKLHGGLRHLHEDFELSADQLLKWTTALDAYHAFTTNQDRRRRIEEFLVAAARWLDDRDFVTPYMGYPNYARLHDLRHYHACFAYLCARGYQLSGDKRLAEEVAFFRDRMLRGRRNSGSANSLNLVLEALTRLVALVPEDTDAWLSLARADWQARQTYFQPDGTATHSGYVWNEGPRMAVNYLVAKALLPEIEGDFDVPALLLAYNTKDRFYHLARGQEIPTRLDDGGVCTCRHAVLGLSYASWLRAYWLLRSEAL